MTDGYFLVYTRFSKVAICGPQGRIRPLEVICEFPLLSVQNFRICIKVVFSYLDMTTHFGSIIFFIFYLKFNKESL